jgi:hypothetical protein
MGTGAVSPSIERQGCENIHSPISSAKVKNGGAIPPLTHISSCCGAQLIKPGDKFTCNFMYG